MKRLLITGSSGFVGKNILPILLQNGFTCRCIIHNTPLPTHIKNHPLIEINKADITKYSSLKKSFANIDAVIHMAAQVDSIDLNMQKRTNVLGTENIIRIVKENNINRIIFISGYPAGLNKKRGVYGETKAKAEELVIHSGLNHTIFRAGVLYGMDDPRNLSKLLRLAWKFPFAIIPGNGRNLIQPLYCPDMAPPLIASLNNPISFGKLYLLGGLKAITMESFVDTFLRSNNLKRLKIKIPLTLLKIGSKFNEVISKNPILSHERLERFLMNQVLDISLAQKDLGFNPKPYDETLRDFYQKCVSSNLNNS